MKKSAQRNEAICSKPECGAATQKPRSGYSKVRALCIKPSLLDTKKKKKEEKDLAEGRKKPRGKIKVPGVSSVMPSSPRLALRIVHRTQTFASSQQMLRTVTVPSERLKRIPLGKRGSDAEGQDIKGRTDQLQRSRSAESRACGCPVCAAATSRVERGQDTSRAVQESARDSPGAKSCPPLFL